MGEFRIHQCRLFKYTPKAIHCIAYEPTHQKLALSRSDGSIELWNIKENWLHEKILPVSEDQSVEALLWCQQRLFSAGLHGDLHEHDLLTGQIKSTVSSNSGAIWCLAQSDTGSHIAAGTEDGCLVLYSVTKNSVEYSRALNKQADRILSIAWFSPEEVIVTGGIDNIRVWSFTSGHAIQRLTVPRTEKHKETIVWTLAVTRDFTIISGDSRGMTCFWNGRQGTLLKSFQAHKADVLCLCVSPDGNSVFSSGIDPTVIQFEYIAANSSSDWNMWFRSSTRMQHTHDVRALSFVKDGIVSGGVDTHIIFNNLEEKSGILLWRRIPALPQLPLVYTARTTGVVLFRYPDSLELWKLGSTNKKSEKSGEFLPLNTNPIKLLELKSKGGEFITCAAVSHDAQWLAYSESHRLRLFKTTIESCDVSCPKVSIIRFGCMPPGVQPSNYLLFSPDGTKLISATNRGDIQVLKLDMFQPELQSLEVPHKDGDLSSIVQMAISPSGKYLATGDLAGNVHVFNLDKLGHTVSLPHSQHIPTALCFHPSSPMLLVVYSNQTLVEFNIPRHEYTDWTRRHRDQFPTQRKKLIVRQILYYPSNPDLILMSDGQSLCIIDKRQPFPDKNAVIKPGSSERPVKHAFHICTNFKYLLHLDVLEDDFLLLVERTPLSIQETLPPNFKQKKFGT